MAPARRNPVDGAPVRVEQRTILGDIKRENALGEHFLAPARGLANQLPRGWHQRRSLWIAEPVLLRGALGIDEITPNHHLLQVGLALGGAPRRAQRLARVAYREKVEILE